MLWHYPQGTVVLPKHSYDEDGCSVNVQEIITQDAFNHDELAYVNYCSEQSLNVTENTEQEIYDAVKLFVNVHILKEVDLDRDRQLNFWKLSYPEEANELSERVIVPETYLQLHGF